MKQIYELDDSEAIDAFVDWLRNEKGIELDPECVSLSVKDGGISHTYMIETE